MRDLVLLPGFMCDQDLWTDMVPDLQKLGTPHYGNVYEDSTLEGMAQRVLDSSPARFVLVGFSMGGFVARVLCLMAPERVSGVAFVASSARGYSEAETEQRKKGYGPLGRPPRATSGAPGLHPDRDKDPVLIGFSMGGFVARVLCLMAPERVSGVAFVASSARGYSEEETEQRKKGYGPLGRPPR
ncbi:MAG TPA: alpha/beta fold hydrolase, partial [Reyranella sp.]|nr:alpha/beta fold hydrolase [Reyranella sp.]